MSGHLLSVGTLTSRLRRYVDERGRITAGQWVSLLTAPVVMPHSGGIFRSTTFDVRAGRLFVEHERAMVR